MHKTGQGDIAVVIVTFNQHDVLRKCLQSVIPAMEGVKGSILVIDNASQDETPNLMKNEFPQISYLRNDTNLYFTRAVNQGIRATKGEFLFVLNDDTELTNETIKKILQFMHNKPRCGGVGPVTTSAKGQVYVSAQKFPTPLREALNIFDISYYLRNKSWMSPLQLQYKLPMHTQKVDWLCGGVLVLRRCALEEINYYDEKYLFYRDDPDNGIRLKRAGWELWFYSETAVVHHEGLSTRKVNRWVLFAIFAIRSRRHYHFKFHGIFGVILVESADFAATIMRLIKRLITLDFENAKKQIRYLLALIEAFQMPKEEKQAIKAYESALYNGKNR